MFDHSCIRRKWLLAIAAGALATFAAAPSGYAQGTWTGLAPVPSPTEGMTVGGAGQVIIAAYGAATGVDTNATRLYNITADSWSFGLPGPGPARSEAAYGDTTHAGFLYVIGGGSSEGGVFHDVNRYDPVMDVWTTVAPMPTARAGAVAAAVDNTIFVIGGRTTAGGPCGSGPYLATVEKYDVDTNTWSTVAALPSPRADLAAVKTPLLEDNRPVTHVVGHLPQLGHAVAGQYEVVPCVARHDLLGERAKPLIGV